MEIEFQGHYDRKSFQKAVFLVGLPSKRNQLLRLALSAVALLAMIAVVVGTIIEAREISVRLLRTGVSFLIVIYVLMQPYVSAYLVSRRLWKDPKIREPMSGTVTSQGITYIGCAEKDEVRWEKFVSITKDKDWIALLTDNRIVSLFPRRFFQSDRDWDVFEKWVATKVVEPK